MKRYIKASFTTDDIVYHYNHDAYPDVDESATIAQYFCDHGRASFVKQNKNQYSVHVTDYNDPDTYFDDFYSSKDIEWAIADFNKYISKFFGTTKKLSYQDVMDVVESYNTPTEPLRTIYDITDSIEHTYDLLTKDGYDIDYNDGVQYNGRGEYYTLTYDRDSDINNTVPITLLIDYLNKNKRNIERFGYRIVNDSNNKLAVIGIGKE